MSVHKLVHMRNDVAKVISRLIPYESKICRLTVSTDLGAGCWLPYEIFRVGSMAEGVLNIAKRIKKFYDEDGSTKDFQDILDASLKIYDLTTKLDSGFISNIEKLDVRPYLNPDSMLLNIDTCIQACAIVNATMSADNVFAPQFNEIAEFVMTGTAVLACSALAVFEGDNATSVELFVNSPLKPLHDGATLMFKLNDKQVNFNRAEIETMMRVEEENRQAAIREEKNRNDDKFVDESIEEFNTILSVAPESIKMKKLTRELLAELATYLDNASDTDERDDVATAKHIKLVFPALRATYGDMNDNWNREFFDDLVKNVSVYITANDNSVEHPCSIRGIRMFVRMLNCLTTGHVFFTASDMSTAEDIYSMPPSRPNVGLSIYMIAPVNGK